MTRPLDRLVLGAIAGFVATMPMTAAMWRLHRDLPRAERYPLPPREISEDMPRPGMSAGTATLLHHFLYGAATGAIYGGAFRHGSIAGGALFGVGVWAASYLGWLPAARILLPATRHPARRNALMLAVHLVWGASLAAGLRELETARKASFSLSTSPHPVLEDRADTPR